MSRAKRADLHERLTGQIRHLIAGAIFFNQWVADQVGLRLTDMQCMNVLDLWGPTTPGKLGQYTSLSPGGVTVMLDRLEKGGWVKRAPNLEDRRSVVVSVNAKKLRPIHGYYDQMQQATVSVLAATPEEELLVLERFFERLSSVRANIGPGGAVAPSSSVPEP